MNASNPPVYYLHVSIRGHATTVLVNGAPVCRTGLLAYNAIPSVSEWMIAGDNEISVEVHAVEPAPAVPDPDSPQRVHVQLCVGALGEMVEPGSEQVLCELRHDPARVRDPQAPRRLAMTHHLPRWPRWAWQDAPPFPEDEATDAELWTFLESLHADLQDGRIDAVTARERVKFAELAPLYGSTPAEAVALTREQFAELSALATWSVAPLDPAEIVLRRCCGGRVVELIDRDGRAALRSGPEMADAAWSLHAFVARVNGLLEIVR